MLNKSRFSPALSLPRQSLYPKTRRSLARPQRVKGRGVSSWAHGATNKKHHLCASPPSGEAGRVPVEGLNDARGLHGKRRVSTRQGRAVEKRDLFSILLGFAQWTTALFVSPSPLHRR